MASLMRRGAGARFAAALAGCAALTGPIGVAAQPVTAPAPARAGYSLAFVDADARHVVDAVLGDMLHVTYSIDPRVTGAITLRTPQAVDRDGVMALLEKALDTIGAAMVSRDGNYRIVPREAARTAALMNATGAGSGTGFAGEVGTLRYANPQEIARLIGLFVGKDVVAGADPAYNQIVLTGSSEERAAAQALIKRFDVDALARASFEMIRLENVDADALEAELAKIFQPPLDIIGTRVRIVPLPRLRSVLAIAVDASDIARIRPWIARLDAGGASTKRKLYSYAVQNGRARDLAQSLQAVLGGGGMTATGSSIAAPQPTARSLLDTASTQGSAPTQGGRGGPGAASVAGQTVAPADTGLASLTANSTTAAPLSLPSLSGGGSSTGPRIVPMEATNTLLIYANGEDYDFIRETLAQIDRPVPQIMIEATLAEVTLTRDLQYGVNWSAISGNSSFTLSNTDGAVPAASFPGVSYAYIGKSVQAVLNTLQSKTNVRVLSAPKLMVLNNQTASLEVGDQVPIVTQQSQSVATAGAPIINTVEMRDTGVILKVTPRVNESGAVTLDIAQEVSDVVRTTTSGINSPTIQQRRLSSTVMTRSGQMVALGGLIREDSSRQRSGMPGLSGIPVLGGLFGQRTDTGSRTELIILLTPLVMRAPDEARLAVDDVLRRLGSVKPLLDDAARPAAMPDAAPR
jgi:general secretion pathway protein D